MKFSLHDLNDSTVAILFFTTEQFDKGLAHQTVKTFVSSSADLLPGAWIESWHFNSIIERWVIKIWTE